MSCCVFDSLGPHAFPLLCGSWGQLQQEYQPWHQKLEQQQQEQQQQQTNKVLDIVMQADEPRNYSTKLMAKLLLCSLLVALCSACGDNGNEGARCGL